MMIYFSFYQQLILKSTYESILLIEIMQNQQNQHLIRRFQLQDVFHYNRRAQQSKKLKQKILKTEIHNRQKNMSQYLSQLYQRGLQLKERQRKLRQRQLQRCYQAQMELKRQKKNRQKSQLEYYRQISKNIPAFHNQILDLKKIHRVDSSMDYRIQSSFDSRIHTKAGRDRNIHSSLQELSPRRVINYKPKRLITLQGTLILPQIASVKSLVQSPNFQH